jgi:hypothetical protein
MKNAFSGHPHKLQSEMDRVWSSVVYTSILCDRENRAIFKRLCTALVMLNPQCQDKWRQVCNRGS